MERRQRSAESQLEFTQFGAEDKTDDDVLRNLSVFEREKLRTQISHLHKDLNHASQAVMAQSEEELAN